MMTVNNKRNLIQKVTHEGDVRLSHENNVDEEHEESQANSLQVSKRKSNLKYISD